MSVSMYQSNVNRLQGQVANIRKDISNDIGKKARLLGEISRIERSITKNTSLSMRQTKQHQINGKLKELARLDKRIADNEKKLSSKNGELSRNQKNLDNALEREAKKKREQERKLERERKREQDEALKRTKALNAELKTQRSMTGSPLRIGGPVSIYGGHVSIEDEETLEEKLQKAFPRKRPSTRELFKRIVEEWHKYDSGEKYNYQEEIAWEVGIQVSTLYQYLRLLRKNEFLPPKED